MNVFDIFAFIWGILDAMFRFVENGFSAMFPYLPPSSMPFVIAIFCYSVLAGLVWAINQTDKSVKRVGLKIVYYTFTVLIILMFIWRMGLIAMIPSGDIVSNVSEFFITLFYVVFGIFLVYSFLKKVTWLKRGILIFTWTVFLFDVFLIAPAFGEMALNENTITSVLILSIIFAIPNGLNRWQKVKESGV